MRALWTTAELDVPAAVVWELVADPSQWPAWGPSVRSASIVGDELELGTRGTVTTVGGLRLPFEITEFEPGRRWTWQVGGVPATDHVVEPVAPHRCRVGFGVPWPVAPYLVVCRLALRRLGRLASVGPVPRSA